jgi:hypothetical protein
MEFVANLAEIFAIALAATGAVALLTRLSGSKPDRRRMFAIAIGLIDILPLLSDEARPKPLRGSA